MSIPPRLAGRIRLALAFAVAGRLPLHGPRAGAGPPGGARGGHRLDGPDARHRQVAHDVRGQPLRGGGRPRDAARGRQRRRCRDRRATRAEPGRAAILGHRRRRLRPALGRRPQGSSRATTAARRRRRPPSPTASWSTASRATFDDAIFGGLSVGVPGTAARCSKPLHKQHGRLPWARLFAPAIRLADRRLPRLAAPAPAAALVRRGQLRARPRGAISSTRPAAPVPPATCCGTRSSPPRCAPSPSAAPDAFYAGPIAEAIVEAVRTAPNHQGDITAGRSRRLPRQGARAALLRLSRAIASAAWDRPRRAASRSRRS